MSTQQLCDFIRAHPRLTVLSGAGCSVPSGIPEYRDDDGNWKHRQPVQFSEFTGSEFSRKRYWARSLVGWTRIGRARPNPAHLALASLEESQNVNCLITQNVDNLHREAGSRNVVDLHGVLEKVVCLQCNVRFSRDQFQARLESANPDWRTPDFVAAPDGDASFESPAFDSFDVPDCEDCGGTIKPDVVFFGEAVPRQRVDRAKKSLADSDGLLVVGSSLMVWSGFRFARQAIETGKSLAILNRGKTRADDIATVRIGGDCAEILSNAVRML